jgi:endo-cleaving rubber dioxygenase
MRPSPEHGRFVAAGLFSLWLLAGCAGDYSGDADGGDGGPGPGGGSFSGPEDFYAKRVEPRLAFCRNCHLPGGVADVDDGRLLMLGPQPGNDYALLRASWEALGGNNPESRILLMASGRDTRSHSGGTPWPLGSAAYADVKTLLGCFGNPAGCLDNAGGAPVTEDAPLLGSKRAQHVWASYCDGKDDGAVLPQDPRTLVQPGVIATDRAVFFNAWWQDCHAHMPQAERQAKTCGEYRARRDRGLAFLMDELPVGASSAEAHNSRNGACPAGPTTSTSSTRCATASTTRRSTTPTRCRARTRRRRTAAPAACRWACASARTRTASGPARSAPRPASSATAARSASRRSART